MPHIGSVATTPSVQMDYGLVEAERFVGRQEARLARSVGLKQFGVNHVTLAPGAWSSLQHWHEQEDEFVFVLVGTLTLVDEAGVYELGPGQFAAFPAGEPNGHSIQNRSSEPGVFLVVGSRRAGEETIHYPGQDFSPVRK